MKNATIWDGALGIAAIAATILLGQIAWNILSQGGAPDFWTVLSAIATTAATLVALFVVFKSERERGREEAIRARLAAAQLAPALLEAKAKLNAARQRFEVALETKAASSHYRAASTMLKQVIELQPSFESLRNLASLPDDCADRIAAGFAQTKLISTMLIEDVDVYGDHPEQFSIRRMKCRMYIGMTKGILLSVEPAVVTCNQAAKIKIGGPGVK
jgi:hypothetical protein